MSVFNDIVKEQIAKKLLKMFSKTSMLESNFKLNFETACMELYGNWTLPRMFFGIYSASKKLHIAFCMFYPVSGVKLPFNCKHIQEGRTMLHFILEKAI